MNQLILFLFGIVFLAIAPVLGRKALGSNNPDKIFYLGVAAIFAASAGIIALSVFFGGI